MFCIFFLFVLSVCSEDFFNHTHTHAHTHITRNTHALVCVGDFMSAVTVQDMLRALDAIASIRYAIPTWFSRNNYCFPCVLQNCKVHLSQNFTIRTALQNFCGDFVCCPKARNSNKVPLFLCHATLLLQHATPPHHHLNHTPTTPPPRYVV